MRVRVILMLVINIFMGGGGGFKTKTVFQSNLIA